MVNIINDTIAYTRYCVNINIINDAIAYTRYWRFASPQDHSISMFVAIVKKHLIRERKAFGAPLLDNQYIHFRLAELLTEVEMLRC